METHRSTTLILFSGLAADAAVFAPQKIAFPQLIVPQWPIPLAEDTLETYCDRIAADLQLDSDAIIGGASFGGIIALHVAQRVNPRAVLLIGSVRSPAELSRIVKVCRPLRPLVFLLPVRFLQWCCEPFASRIACRFLPHLGGLARQFCGSNPTVFKWSLSRILDWEIAPKISSPVYHIHGDLDYVLPIRNTQPDAVVSGGGHVISLTHSAKVNDFIRSAIPQAVREPGLST